MRPTGYVISEEKPISVNQVTSRVFQSFVKLAWSTLLHKDSAGSSRRAGTLRNAFYTGNGYHYEADEVRCCVESGFVESSVMQLADSLAVMATIDEIRASLSSTKQT